MAALLTQLFAVSFLFIIGGSCDNGNILFDQCSHMASRFRSLCYATLQKAALPVNYDFFKNRVSYLALDRHNVAWLIISCPFLYLSYC